MPGEPVLVVDDNAMNLKLMSVFLASEGYDVRAAADADEALSLLRSFRPRLILMDVQLPGVDGLSLTRRLKGDPATRDIVIVATTSYAMAGDAEKALSAGCDDYVSKPIDTRTLPGLIARWLRSGRGTASGGT